MPDPTPRLGYIGWGGRVVEVPDPIDLGYGAYRRTPQFGIRRAVFDAAYGYVNGFPATAITYYILTRSLHWRLLRRAMLHEGHRWDDAARAPIAPTHPLSERNRRMTENAAYNPIDGGLAGLRNALAERLVRHAVEHQGQYGYDGVDWKTQDPDTYAVWDEIAGVTVDFLLNTGDDNPLTVAQEAMLALLAARGDAATPTEVEWGVRLVTGRIRSMPDEAAAHREAASLNAIYARETHVVQRTVSAWREVTP